MAQSGPPNDANAGPPVASGEGEADSEPLSAPPRAGASAPAEKDGAPRRASLAGLVRIAKFTALAIVAVVVLSVFMVGVYRFVGPPGTFTMLERKLSGDVIIHPWTKLSDISPHLVYAVIAAEDSRFCVHGGIDFEAIEQAMDEAEKGGRLRGASTISQQTAKNAFLWNGGGWVRKGAEAWFTVIMEALWPKRRIMEVYLNIAEWGEGNFGAEAAAQARFGKPASDLTKQEAALLAAVLPNPHKWRVNPPGPYVRGRAETLRQRMDRVRIYGLAACVLE